MLVPTLQVYDEKRAKSEKELAGTEVMMEKIGESLQTLSERFDELEEEKAVLEEFELLEKYADDYSFTSNCSLIKPRPKYQKKQVSLLDA